MTALLRLDDVACIRGDRRLFESVSLTLAPGEALWLRGPNGTGKSSLIRLVAGLLRPAAGTVERFGRLDFAHNNAGINRPGSNEWDSEDWHLSIRVNLDSVMFCMRAEIAAAAHETLEVRIFKT